MQSQCSNPSIGKIKGILALHDDQMLNLRKINRDFDLFIGIDPGVKTGFSQWSKREKRLIVVKTEAIHVAMRDCEFLLKIYHKHRILIRLEDARLRKVFPREKNNAEYRGHLMGAGSIKRDCKIWEDYITDIGIAFELVAPATHKTKWTANYFKQVTKWEGPTDEHARDAAVLVYGL